MSDPLSQETAPSSTASASEFIATITAILAAIAFLLLFDTALAKIDSGVRRSSAASEYRAGDRLMAEGNLRDAIEHLRTASTLDVENSTYATALAQAILADNRPADAEQMLGPLLERNATDGAANLAMARVLVKQRRVEEAKSYYHRAIYGLWPRDAPRNRAVARFELIDVLARTDAKQELLSELLPIQDDTTNDTTARKRLAHLFVVAGSPARAVSIYRELMRRNPGDADVYVGLGEAALSLGDYSTARADFLAASRLMPEDSVIQSRISLTDSVIAIDPTQRGLSLAEQYRRSRNLVQRTLASVRACLGAEAPQVAVALDSATRMLVTPARSSGQGQGIEESLSLAEQLWGLRKTRCTPGSGDEALALVQARLAQ